MIESIDMGAVRRRLLDIFSSLTPIARLRIAVYIVFALQFSKVGWIVPVGEIFDGTPLIQYHYSQIYSDVTNDRDLTRLSGKSWGYDPSISAGVPVGSGLVQESHGPILFDRLLRRWASPSSTIKLFFWLAFLAGPLLLVSAALFFGFDEASSIITLALVAGGALGHEYLSRTLLYNGQITCWLAMHLALFNAGALYAGAARESKIGAVAYAGTLPFLVLLDPAVAVMQTVPVVMLLAGASSRRRPLVLAWTAIGTALAIPINAFWMRPFFLFHRFSTGELEWPTPGISGFLASVVPVHQSPLGILWAGLRGYILIFGVSELVLVLAEKRVHARVMLAWAGALFLIAFFGQYFSWIRPLEPARLGLELFLLVTIPASAFMATTFLKPGSRRILIFIWSLWLLVSWQAARQVVQYPIRTAFTWTEVRMLRDLRMLPRDRRVLVEYSTEINDMLRMSSESTNHLFLGFPSTWVNTKFNRSTGFNHSGGYVSLFGRRLDSYDAPTLQAALERYNVGIIIVTSDEARRILDEFPGIVKPYRAREDTDNYWIFEARSKRNSYFINGEGRVWFKRNLIHVQTNGSGPSMLSLHWVDGLRAKPPVSVHAQYIEGDEVPFLAIENPSAIKDFEIRYDPR